MRFHEAVEAMAQGSCCKSQWGAIHKYDPKYGGFCWMQEKWMKEGFATHETLGNWEIVADPSVKPIKFSEAMAAIEQGKAVKSCEDWIYWIGKEGLAMSYQQDNPNGPLKGNFVFPTVEVNSNWTIVPIPEVTNA